MFEITLTLLVVALVYISYDLGNTLKTISNTLIIISNEFNSNEDGTGETKTSYEIEKEIREAEFDERIRQMQSELDSIHPGQTNTPEILAKGIYNLPDYYIKPSPNEEEVSE